jgi:hypothetical protein
LVFIRKRIDLQEMRKAARVSAGTCLTLFVVGISVEGFLPYYQRPAIIFRHETILIHHAEKKFEEKEFNIDDILAEADEALKVADQALSSSSDDDNDNQLRNMSTPDEKVQPSPRSAVSSASPTETQEQIASAQTPASAVGSAPAPTIAAREQTTSAQAKATEGERRKREARIEGERRKREARIEGANRVVEMGFQAVGGALSSFLGGAASSAKDSVSRQIESTVDEVVHLPERAAESAQQKTREAADAARRRAKETSDEINSIPTKLKEAAQQKVKDFTDLPGKILGTAKRSVSDFPTLQNWRQNSNGSITGVITGSITGNFENGAEITTAVVKQEAAEGGLIETISGTKYFLGTKAPETESSGIDMLLGLLFIGSSNSTKASTPLPVEQAVIREEKRREPVASNEVAKRIQDAMESLKKAQPRQTFSLAALFAGEDAGTDGARRKAVTSRPPQRVEAPPRGVPVITKWRQNSDRSISGFISGSSNFEEGEAVTTSPINGEAIAKAVVTTETGSR